MTEKVLWQGSDVVCSVRGDGHDDWTANNVAIDSRTVQKGDLFIALKGPVYDGHDFVESAFKFGASAAIVSHPVSGIPAQHPLIRVNDTFAALQDLGSRSRARTQAHIVAVTGSVGKTGSKEQLRHMLSGIGSGTAFASQGSFNNHWGVPLSLSRMPQDTSWGVFELGMNHSGELAPLARQVQPHVALITNIEAVHLEHFSSVEAIADAKAEIFLGMNAAGVAVINRDTPHFARLTAAAKTQGLQTVLSFGNTAGADARLLDCTPHDDHSIVRAEFFGKELSYKIAAPGVHYAFNSLGTILAAQAACAPLEKCAETLASFTPPSGRGARQNVALPNGGAVTIIDESYNASPVATRAAIAMLGQANPTGHGRRIAILGDMRELGATAPQLHAELAPHLIAAKIDRVYCAGHIIEGLFAALPASMQGRYTSDSKGLANIVPHHLQDGDIVLVKGSRSMRMDLVVAAIQAQAPVQKAG